MSSCYVVFSVVCFFKTHLLCSIPLYEYAPLPFSVHDRLGVSGLGLLGIVMLSLVSFVYCNYFVLDGAFPFHSLVPLCRRRVINFNELQHSYLFLYGYCIVCSIKEV